MYTGSIAMRYARALADYADRHEATERVYADARALQRCFVDFPALRRALSNRLATAAQKTDLVAACCGAGVSAEFMRFAALVLEMRREELLQYICLNFMALVRERQGLLEVDLTTAMPLDEEMTGMIARKIGEVTGKIVAITPTIDPSIIGGYVARWDTWRQDASIAGRLKQIERSLKLS